MNYRHIYHAGHFTDVVKHCILVQVIDYLRQKPSPFCYIDTHAGEGIYNLNSPEAEKTRAYTEGVIRLIRSPLPHPGSMNQYLEIISRYQSQDTMTYYPGSPYFAYFLLRQQDRMILNEYHPATYAILKKNFQDKEQVAIHQRDAYEFLPGIVPPKISRGVVLIDPPFESPEENDRIKLSLEKSLKRWPQGIYIIWYPITVERSWNIESVALHPLVNQYLIAEFSVQAQGPHIKGLIGCRLLVINPPWTLNNDLKTLLPHLWQIFSINHQGAWRVVDSTH